MRRRLDEGLRRLWNEEAGPSLRLAALTLLPPELLWRAVVALRNGAYDRGWIDAAEPPIPVVSVGNLLVGGTGKTPVAAHVARILADHGRAPALVSRGYGEDELALHRQWNPDVPVYADPERRRALEAAADDGCRSAVLDDAFQHRRLQRSLDLLLHPVEGPWSGRVLPRGPYREPWAAARRADRVILTRRAADREKARRAEARVRELLPEIPVAHALLEPDGWVTLAGETAPTPTGPLLAVTGIARPASFQALVRRVTGSPVELVSFPDHHVFTDRELEGIRRTAGGRPVVTTEKDARRMAGRPRLPEDVRVLRLALREEEGWDDLQRALFRATDQAGVSAGGEGDRTRDAATRPERR